MKKKTVLITGASSGIGMATALLLHQKGYRVYAAARRVAKMKDLEQAGIRVVAMDVTSEESIMAAFKTISAEVGTIDILVNNAGLGSYGAVEDVPISEGRYLFEVHVFGLARLIQLVLPHMRTQRAGTIINISSVGGRIGEPHGAWYHATKFAVEGFSDSLRMELKEFGINVIVIQPGGIKTEMNRIARENLMRVSGSTAYGNLARKHIIMLEDADKRGSKPEVVAETIAKAVEAKSPRTRYATGDRAKLALAMQRLLTDKAFDWVMLSQMK